MLRFFRKIRLELINNNGFGRYAVYAIGEIFLVVLGILIALQINNWNERQKTLKAEQIILQDLKVEIESNIKDLGYVIVENRHALNCATYLSKFYKQPELIEITPLDSISKRVFRLPGSVFHAETGILNALISSGQINTFENKNLKYNLAALNDTYLKKIEYSKFVQDLGNKYFDEKIYPQIVQVINNGKVSGFQLKKIFEIPEFSLAIHGTFGERRRIAIKNEEQLKEHYEEILEMINKAIKSK